MPSVSTHLDTLYLPSRWSKRLSPTNVILHHLNFGEKESAKVRSTIPCSLGIHYGPSKNQTLDIFGTDLPKGGEILVFIHGGYWQEASANAELYHYIAKHFYKNKIKTIFMEYDLCPSVSLQEIIQQSESAILGCIKYAEENKSRGLHLMGHSAGAHLITTLFTNLTKLLSPEKRDFIKSAVLLAGVYDLTELTRTSLNEALKLNESQAMVLSPFRQKILTKETVFYVIYGENDSPVFKSQSDDFNELLTQDYVKSLKIQVDEVDHFDLIERFAESNYELTNFLIRVITK